MPLSSVSLPRIVEEIEEKTPRSRELLEELLAAPHGIGMDRIHSGGFPNQATALIDARLAKLDRSASVPQIVLAIREAEGYALPFGDSTNLEKNVGQSLVLNNSSFPKTVSQLQAAGAQYFVTAIKPGASVMKICGLFGDPTLYELSKISSPQGLGRWTIARC